MATDTAEVLIPEPDEDLRELFDETLRAVAVEEAKPEEERSRRAFSIADRCDGDPVRASLLADYMISRVREIHARQAQIREMAAERRRRTDEWERRALQVQQRQVDRITGLLAVYAEDFFSPRERTIRLQEGELVRRHGREEVKLVSIAGKTNEALLLQFLREHASPEEYDQLVELAPKVRLREFRKLLAPRGDGGVTWKPTGEAVVLTEAALDGEAVVERKLAWVERSQDSFEVKPRPVPGSEESVEDGE